MGRLGDEIFKNYYSIFLLKILPSRNTKFSQKNT